MLNFTFFHFFYVLKLNFFLLLTVLFLGEGYTPTSFIIVVARNTFTSPSSNVTPTSSVVAPRSSNVAAASSNLTPTSFINRDACFTFLALLLNCLSEHYIWITI